MEIVLSKKILLIIGLLLAPFFVMAVETTSNAPVSSNGGISSSNPIPHGQIITTPSVSAITLNSESKNYLDNEHVEESILTEDSKSTIKLSANIHDIFERFFINEAFALMGIIIICIGLITFNLRIAFAGGIAAVLPYILVAPVSLADKISAAIFSIEPSIEEGFNWLFLLLIGVFIIIAIFISLWANNESEPNEIRGDIILPEQAVADSSSSEVSKLKRKVVL